MAELYTDESGIKSEQPTALRLTEARRAGKVPRSGELSSGVLVLGGVIALGVLGPSLLDALTRMTAVLLKGGTDPLSDPHQTLTMLWGSLRGVLGVVASLCFVLLVLGVVGNVVQVGFLVAGERIHPNLGRISPVEGLRRIASARSLVRVVLGVVKVGVIAALVAWFLRAHGERVIGLSHARSDDLGPLTGKLLYDFAIRAGGVLLVLGGVDYAYQRWQHRRDLRITARQLREDLRRLGASGVLRRGRVPKSV